MYTVEMLSESLELARQLGYQIREDQLEGAGGGHCLIRGHKWLLLDVTQSADDQLRDVLDAIRGDFSASGQLLKDRLQAGPSQISPELAKALADSEPETVGNGQRAA
jgi:hypothetical protein